MEVSTFEGNTLYFSPVADLRFSVVLAGTNGEAVTLSHSEKSELVRRTREIAIKNGRPDLTITLGCGGQCTRDAIAETRLAKDAGADYVLVLTPSYFHFAMNQDAIVSFFQEVRIPGDFPSLGQSETY